MATIDEKLRLDKLHEIIEVLKNNSSQTLIIFERIKTLICLFEAHTRQSKHRPKHGGLFRHEVIDRLQVRHAFVVLVADNLVTYMTEVRAL